MIIYGTAVLAICVLVGKVIGTVLGEIAGINADIGGVGFAMILLLMATGWLRSKKLLPAPTERGVMFWSGIYIPIVVAMSATQNVRGALDGGVMAIITGIVVVVASVALVPAIARIGAPSEPLPPITEKEEQDA